MCTILRRRRAGPTRLAFHVGIVGPRMLSPSCFGLGSWISREQLRRRRRRSHRSNVGLPSSSVQFGLEFALRIGLSWSSVGYIGERESGGLIHRKEGGARAGKEGIDATHTEGSRGRRQRSSVALFCTGASDRAFILPFCLTPRVHIEGFDINEEDRPRAQGVEQERQIWQRLGLGLNPAPICWMRETHQIPPFSGRLIGFGNGTTWSCDFLLLRRVPAVLGAEEKMTRAVRIHFKE